MEATLSLLNTPRNWAFLVAALAVIATPWIVRAPLRRSLDARRLQRAVESLGVRCARNVSIPDGGDGVVYIDHLVMTPKFLLVLLVKRYPGAIFGGSDIDQWAQVMREGSFKFDNPLREVQDLVGLLRAQCPKVPIRGAVLFDRESTFPKGKPKGVLHVADIDPRRMRAKSTEVPLSLQRAWQRLCPEQSGAAPGVPARQ